MNVPKTRNVPLGSMDERPVQLVKHKRPLFRSKPGHPRRIDDEYERVGVATDLLIHQSPSRVAARLNQGTSDCYRLGNPGSQVPLR